MIVINFTFHSGAQPVLFFFFSSTSAVVVNLGSIQHFLFYFEGSPCVLSYFSLAVFVLSPAPFFGSPH